MGMYRDSEPLELMEVVRVAGERVNEYHEYLHETPEFVIDGGCGGWSQWVEDGGVIMAPSYVSNEGLMLIPHDASEDRVEAILALRDGRYRDAFEPYALHRNAKADGASG